MNLYSRMISCVDSTEMKMYVEMFRVVWLREAYVGHSEALVCDSDIMWVKEVYTPVRR